MRTVAFIPARGGSKRIPAKNLREVNGRSLLHRAIGSAFGAGLDAVVSTDDSLIAAHARGAQIHERPASLATDTARVEDAIAHWLTEGHTPDVIVLLQPTSPLRTAEHVRDALALMERTKADTLVSVCVSHTHHFAARLEPRETINPLWCEASAATAFYAWHTPRLPQPSTSQRTQDLAPFAHENGAIYAVTREHFERTGSLHGGHSVAYVMDPLDSIDVDSPRDLYLAAIYESVRRDEGSGREAEWWCGMARDGIDT